MFLVGFVEGAAVIGSTVAVPGDMMGPSRASRGAYRRGSGRHNPFSDLPVYSGVDRTMPAVASESVAPLTIGVCSWSLQVQSIDELKNLTDRLGVEAVQIACGDPHHASWDEGEAMPEKALASGLSLRGAMLGFEGEDYTTPETIKKTGGFGDPETRDARLERLTWGLKRTRALGLTDLMFHAGFIPQPTDPDRPAFLETLIRIAKMAREYGVTVAFETGQETALMLKHTLDQLAEPSLMVNFDPANMLLYDMGDPIEAVRVLGSRIRSVHLKDAKRPTEPGQWGQEVPLGQGEVDLPAFLKVLRGIGYRGPLFIEREVGDQDGRIRDIRAGVEYIRPLLAELR